MACELAVRLTVASVTLQGNGWLSSLGVLSGAFSVASHMLFVTLNSLTPFPSPSYTHSQALPQSLGQCGMNYYKAEGMQEQELWYPCVFLVAQFLHPWWHLGWKLIY